MTFTKLFSVNSVIICVLILTSCAASQNSMEIEKLNKKLDILTMVVFNNELYVGTTTGLYILDSANELEEIELNHQVGFIYDLYVHEKYGLFIGGMNGLIIMDNNGSQIYYGDDFLPDQRIYSINSNNEGHIFIGTFNGLLVLDENLEALEVNYELLSEMVNVMGFDNKGNSIFSSYNIRSGGLTIIEDGDSTYYDNKSQITTINTTSLVIGDQLFFVGGGMYETGGFDKFEYSEDGYFLAKSFREEDGLAGPKVRSFLLLGQTLIVGSEYDGFSILNFDDNYDDILSYQIYTSKNGLSHDEIKCMLDYEGYIYFGTKAGLSRMKISIGL